MLDRTSTEVEGILKHKSQVEYLKVIGRESDGYYVSVKEDFVADFFILHKDFFQPGEQIYMTEVEWILPCCELFKVVKNDQKASELPYQEKKKEGDRLKKK